VDGGMIAACAVTEDGEYLCRVICKPWNARHDLGIDSDCLLDVHAVYQLACPEGYSLTWIDQPSADKKLCRAIKRMRDVTI